MRILAIAVAAALGCAATPNRLALVLSFEGDWSEAVVSALQQEVETIFAFAGIGVDQAVLPGAAHFSGGHVVILASFTGDCTGSRPGRLDGSELAATPSVDGFIQPIPRIYCERVNAYLGVSLRDAPSFGSALARILAHEVFHAVTQQRDHHESSLFAAHISREVLAAPSVLFTRTEAAQLAAALEK